MSIGMIGRKIGMTRLFTESGDSVPVTVVDVSNNRVSQLKTVETDGYAAVQVAYGQRRRSRINKATAGHLAKAGVDSARGFHEFNVANVEFEVGQSIDVEVFESTEFVDVSGVTKGKGFACDQTSQLLVSARESWPVDYSQRTWFHWNEPRSRSRLQG